MEVFESYYNGVTCPLMDGNIRIFSTATDRCAAVREPDDLSGEVTTTPCDGPIAPGWVLIAFYAGVVFCRSFLLFECFVCSGYGYVRFVANIGDPTLVPRDEDNTQATVSYELFDRSWQREVEVSHYRFFFWFFFVGVQCALSLCLNNDTFPPILL